MVAIPAMIVDFLKGRKLSKPESYLLSAERSSMC
jgi:hypothetical protein